MVHVELRQEEGWLLQPTLFFGPEATPDRRKHDEEVTPLFLPFSLLRTRVRTRIENGGTSKTVSKPELLCAQTGGGSPEIGTPPFLMKTGSSERHPVFITQETL